MEALSEFHPWSVLRPSPRAFCVGALNMNITKIELVPDGFMVPLAECPEGPFLFDGIVGFKSEYGDNNGFIHAFNEGGEYFWAGTKGPLEQRKLVVQPLRIVKVTS